jgi:tRNA-modifying protein YgfZ
MPITVSTSAATFRWRPACWLRVAGADAATFLQGQFTNDLRGLSAVGVVYGLWLTVKGKVLADSFVACGPNDGEFWIGSYSSRVETIRARLEGYVIADDVTIADETEAWAGVSLLGVGLEQLREAGAGQGVVVFRGRRDQGEGVECVYRIADGVPAWLTGLGADRSEIAASEIARRRIAAGIPAVPMDAGPGDLPNEAGLERDAISYTKGCYLGQEVMARLKAMGQVRRRLLRVRGETAAPPAVPAPLFAATKQVGELRSVAPDGAQGWIGLAMISLLPLGEARELALAADAPPAVRLLDSPVP